MMSRHRLATSLSALLLLAVSGCGGDDPAAKAPIPEGKRETRGAYTVVWLHGTPYEMGYQHGSLLHDELQEAALMLQTDPFFKIMKGAAANAHLDQIALDNSYPDMIAECQGLVDAVANPDFQMFECLLVNFGDVAVEFLLQGVPEIADLAPGCSQIIASGPASADGRLYHARILDWTKVDFVVQNPVIFVRSPNEGLAHAFIGFPGNLSSYQGLNEAGLSIASNEVDPLDNDVHDRTGRSHVQMLVQVLTYAHSLEEARALITGANHMTLETLVVADGNSRTGEVYEMAPARVGIRAQQDGVVFATNHFVAAETDPLDLEPAGESSTLRFERLGQMLDATEEDSEYGKIGPDVLVSMLRDRHNPRTGQESPADEFDDGQSLATNGALYQVVFDPEARSFWVAAGAIPVPAQRYTAFSLDELLGHAPASMPSDIP